MFTKGSIRAEVMKVLNKRIKEAEAEYVSGSAEIEKEAEVKKTALKRELVVKLIGK